MRFEVRDIYAGEIEFALFIYTSAKELSDDGRNELNPRWENRQTEFVNGSFNLRFFRGGTTNGLRPVLWRLLIIPFAVQCLQLKI